jgi:hypothetical protein
VTHYIRSRRSIDAEHVIRRSSGTTTTTSTLQSRVECGHAEVTT